MYSNVAISEKFENSKKTEYFAAIRAGMDRNYRPMKELFHAMIKKNL